jgi:hypothetical protein
MATIGSFKGSEISRSLKRKGFQEGNGDHVFLYLMVDGKRTPVRTKVSHGRKEYRGALWACLKQQLKLENEQLDQLIRCQLSHEDYVGILRADGIIVDADK